MITYEKKYLMDTYNRYPIMLVKGEGTRVWDSEGNAYLDFVAGIAVNSLGHCHPALVEAIKKQAETLIHCSNLYWNEKQIELARMISENSFGGKVFFANSGAEANEGAIKLARKYASLKYGGKRYKIITAKNSFHGRTFGALTATGQEKYHKGFGPLLAGFKYVPLNDIEALYEAVDDEVCAIMLEVIQGEGGIHEATPEYVKAVRKICDENDLLFILDEVQTGIGRTGKLFGYEHYGVVPDIMTLAKGLGGGFPIGAIVAKEDKAVFKPGDHASTFGGNPLACAAGIAVLNEVTKDGFLEGVDKKGKYFREGLETLQKKHKVVKEIRGKGLMVGCEVDLEDASEIVLKALEKGLLINSVSHNVLRFVPPLIVTEEEIDEALQILDDVLSEIRF
ncbi:acetylornithine transaminase [Caldanaerobacter subterraneus]|uniref:Acetylornithine aminotransferase n=4 Tax=Caldanaerobacter subterraneus TaxID=911092 RepID=ARGD_CALS4|nr:acetylornithine transaminase [Caldanaerobacter subterraneus]Q8R7C1.1 RecName: Full=Acetylornithine aminotransferase; Short=ACOAT [Caldanaerobacter subterraneus subsp. tengcongensis MB4]AAM25625.1 PLP-dependent aminotransferases [Caldanaerobacter subterraneus subsp. tengcongensis MB4]KKC28909.1 PLP-dependent aminotransferase [Caldanaerobacter subterraneus subsp. pacificus DSM 12653]NNG66875.1 acetylornithine transaminase [Caldanaerobacter subterraneus]